MSLLLLLLLLSLVLLLLLLLVALRLRLVLQDPWGLLVDVRDRRGPEAEAGATLAAIGGTTPAIAGPAGSVVASLPHVLATVVTLGVGVSSVERDVSCNAVVVSGRQAKIRKRESSCLVEEARGHLFFSFFFFFFFLLFFSSSFFFLLFSLLTSFDFF